MTRSGTGSREESDLLAALLADSRRGTHLGESPKAGMTKTPEQRDLKTDGRLLDRIGFSFMHTHTWSLFLVSAIRIVNGIWRSNCFRSLLYLP